MIAFLCVRSMCFIHLLLLENVSRWKVKKGGSRNVPRYRTAWRQKKNTHIYCPIINDGNPKMSFVDFSGRNLSFYHWINLHWIEKDKVCVECLTVVRMTSVRDVPVCYYRPSDKRISMDQRISRRQDKHRQTDDTFANWKRTTNVHETQKCRCDFIECVGWRLPCVPFNPKHAHLLTVHIDLCKLETETYWMRRRVMCFTNKRDCMQNEWKRITDGMTLNVTTLTHAVLVTIFRTWKFQAQMQIDGSIAYQNDFFYRSVGIYSCSESAFIRVDGLHANSGARLSSRGEIHNFTIRDQYKLPKNRILIVLLNRL